MIETVAKSKKKIALSPQQEAALADVKAGKNIFITGQAGTGKSTVLVCLRQKFGSKLAVTASTGIAAVNVGGSTLHTFAGLGLGKASAEVIAARILAAKQRPYRNITSCEALAIEEVSMVSGQMLDKVDQIFRMVREDSSPFGGVQLVLFGDFLQLPPVSKPEDEEREGPARFAFESNAWREAEIATHLFTRVYRQEEQALVDAFTHLRIGDINHPSVNILAARNNIPLPTDEPRPVVMHTRNVNVDAENAACLAKLPGKEFVFHANDTGVEWGRAKLDKDCLAPKELRLKKGAQVMLLANIDLEAGLANGSLGVVEHVGDGKDTAVRVRFGKNNTITLDRHEWNILDGQKAVATRSQYPLRLAYSITVHKSQGLTLDRIVCHLSERDVFSHGQAYVAVSRVRSLAGLYLVRSSRRSFTAHPKALAFYDEAAALEDYETEEADDSQGALNLAV